MPEKLALSADQIGGSGSRASLEEAAQVALDAADRIIAVLDRMDGDADHEDGGDNEPSLAAPENTEDSQLVYRRGGDQDHEVNSPETALSEVLIEPQFAAEILLWRGRANVISAAAIAMLKLVGGC